MADVQNPIPRAPIKGASLQARTVLAVDYSATKTGLAVSTDGFAPRPLMESNHSCPVRMHVENCGCRQLLTKYVLQVFKPPFRFVDGAKQIVEVAKQQACDTIVVGIPTTPKQEIWDSESDSRIGRRCRNFAHTLAMVAKPHKLNVFVVSERFSTMEAEEDLLSSKRKKKAVQVRVLHLTHEPLILRVINLYAYCTPDDARGLQAKIDAAAAANILERFFLNRGGALYIKPKFGLKPDDYPPAQKEP
jgi:RNase H-fold protein (predicted Holliday junction resolvase)